ASIPHRKRVHRVREVARVDPRAEVRVVDGVVVRVHLVGARRVVGWTEVTSVDTGVRAVLTDVLRERFRRTVAEAVCRARRHGAHPDGCETLLDEVRREGAG